MAFNLEPSFLFINTVNGDYKLTNYTTNYLHDDEILEITENEKKHLARARGLMYNVSGSVWPII